MLNLARFGHVSKRGILHGWCAVPPHASTRAYPPHAKMFARHEMHQLQERMERDHRPTLVQLHDATAAVGTLTVGDVFRAQAYADKQGRHFQAVYANDVQTGSAPGTWAVAVAERAAMAGAAAAAAAVVARRASARARAAADKLGSIPELRLTPAAAPSAGGSSAGARTLSIGKRKRADP